MTLSAIAFSHVFSNTLLDIVLCISHSLNRDLSPFLPPLPCVNCKGSKLLDVIFCNKFFRCWSDIGVGRVEVCALLEGAIWALMKWSSSWSG